MKIMLGWRKKSILPEQYLNIHFLVFLYIILFHRQVEKVLWIVKKDKNSFDYGAHFFK